MSREQYAYRDNLATILEFTGGRHLLTVNDVRQYTGLVDLRTIRRHFPIKNATISAETLARCLAGGDAK